MKLAYRIPRICIWNNNEKGKKKAPARMEGGIEAGALVKTKRNINLLTMFFIYPFSGRVVRFVSNFF